ncbi:hypothetical protein [Haloarchaeobius sp. HME9146]|nr:hypothetical protein [Haloarchaeobius sp. HME9146]MCT9097794.1 hypothetical protein [Haloarchaeobius sp. HME9146]
MLFGGGQCLVLGVEPARISRDEKRALTETLEETFQARRTRDYDDTRWG